MIDKAAMALEILNLREELKATKQENEQLLRLVELLIENGELANKEIEVLKTKIKDV
jgi:hypothetical protein